MDPQDFRIEVEDLANNNGVGTLTIPLQECGQEYNGNVVLNFVTVAVDHSDDPSKIGALPISNSQWILLLDRNVIDCEVPGCGKEGSGIVVGRHSPFTYKRSLTQDHIQILMSTYKSQGLKRYRTRHSGKFFMCSTRQSNMCSSSMSQVSDGMNHHYFDQKSMNTSLLNVSMPIINDLARQAIQHMDNCGQIATGLVRKASFVKLQQTINTMNISPHIIFTAPHFHKPDGYYDAFCNTEHLDNDECDPELGHYTHTYIQESGEPSLQSYYNKLCESFHDRTHSSRRKKFHMPSTCVWIPLENMMDGVCGIRHLQFFVQIEAGCAWNLSSDIFFSGVEQLVGTFFGGLISHVTSCPLWVREDDGHVTILCPGMCANLAWGSNSSNKKGQILKGKKRKK
jgi:hypothetical protein